LTFLTGARCGSRARSSVAASVVIAVILWSAGPASSAPCVVADNGTGTATLPPAGCDYLGTPNPAHPDEKYVITDGMPPGTTLEMVPVHKDFICGQSGSPAPACSIPLPPGICEGPGGSLGGSVSCANSTLELQITGTGFLADFSRTISLQTSWETHSGPRAGSTQNFSTDLQDMSGQLFGDPDFDTLRFTAGTARGLPSPGHTILSDVGAGQWNVDSFFDITYSIDFTGAPGSQLEGFSGTTTSSLRIRTGDTIPTAPPVPTMSRFAAGALIVILLLAGAVFRVHRRMAAA